MTRRTAITNTAIHKVKSAVVPAGESAAQIQRSDLLLCIFGTSEMKGLLLFCVLGGLSSSKLQQGLRGAEMRVQGRR